MLLINTNVNENITKVGIIFSNSNNKYFLFELGRLNMLYIAGPNPVIFQENI